MPHPRQILGALGERYARDHLSRLGYAFVAANVRTRHGELDLIVADARTLVVCEVKTRRTGRGWPLEAALGPGKQARVRRMAASWLASDASRPRRGEIRFDAVGVVVDARGGLVALDHREAAF